MDEYQVARSSSLNPEPPDHPKPSRNPSPTVLASTKTLMQSIADHRTKYEL